MSESNNTFSYRNTIALEKPSKFVETFFCDGPLGVVLRRRAEDGIVFVHEIIPDSQAVNIDVSPGDELWTVGESEIGETPLDKEAWDGLITFIKQSSRPLKLIWHRKNNIDIDIELSKNNIPPLTTIEVAAKESPTFQHSEQFLELQKVLARLTVKEKDASLPFLAVNQSRKFPDPMSLLVEGRRVIKIGDLDLESKSVPTLWMKANNRRRVILTNDYLIVAVPLPGNVFTLEYLIDLPIAKIKSLGHSFGMDEPFRRNPYNTIDEDLSFEIIWPNGELKLVADNKENKDIWILSIFLAICDNVMEDGRVLGWRHQYLLGTMHAAVMSRNEDRVKELLILSGQNKWNPANINSVDQDGYAPLHYACILRLANMVKLLVDADADVSLVDKFGFTAIHWAAMQLDNFSLSILCSKLNNLNLLDMNGRNPLVLACIEGRDISGATDAIVLKDCIQKMLLVDQSSLIWEDTMGQCILHYLAASWQCEAIDIVLQCNSQTIYSLEHEFDMSPLHYAARGSPIKKAIGEGHKLLNNKRQYSDDQLNMAEDLHRHHGTDTIRSLLRNGAKPNQKDKLGRSILHILLDPETSLFWDDDDDLLNAISVSISYGARFDDILSITIKSKFPQFNFLAIQEKWNSFNVLDGKLLDIRLNQFDYQQYISEDVSLSSSQYSTNRNANSGNNNGPACSFCSFVFTMFRRQHHCRLCNNLCCDECSKKRVIVDSSQVRTCDCCYNKIATQTEIYRSQEAAASAQKIRVEGVSKDSNEQKRALFNSSDEANQIHTGNSEKMKSSNKIGNTFSVMNETYDRLQERGEKLNRLADRSEEMVNQASEFARLAKQLNEQQKSRWF